jgi:hypothetical protein
MQDNAPKKANLSIDLSIDLEWLQQSQPLMCSDSTNAPSVPLKALLEHLPKEPDIRHYPAPPAFRLGRVFEDVMAKGIEFSQRFDLVKRNHRIMQDKITLGEMDFLVHDTRESPSQITQWELAIKFYLFRPQFETDRPLERFLGPGGQDRLDKKWHRLIDHQLGMSKRDEAIAGLKQEGFELSDQPSYWLTGALFYPLGFSPENAFIIAPELKHQLNPDHTKGVWLHRHQCPQLERHAQDSDRFWIIQKPHWIGGFRHFSGNEDDLLSPSELTHALKEQTHAAQVAWVEVTDEGYREKTRLMVVPDDWPVGAPARPERAGWTAHS